MKETTLCLLTKGKLGERRLLFGFKKKGFGSGKWNTIGGKFDSSKGDVNIVDTAIRELEEEIGVRVKEIKKIAILDFFFLNENDWDQRAHVFICNDWEGEPKETEEMMPRWFNESQIPYGQMWIDDRLWLPKVLQR